MSTADEREPDRAALDELRRAFGIDEPVEPAEPADDGTALAPFEFEIVEQDPLPPAEPSGRADAPPAASGGAPGQVEPAGGATEAHPDASGEIDGGVDDGSDGSDGDGGGGGVTQGVAAVRVIRIDDLPGVPDPPATGPGRAGVGVIGGPADHGQGERSVPIGGPPGVISIEADDLPDAVYVEGSLAAGGRRGSVVFIDDAGDDVVSTESDRDVRRGIEPRMRERRVAVKRAQGRKRLKWLVACAVVLVLAVAALATFGSSLFAIREDDVRVVGAVYTDPDRLQAVIDDLVGTPVLVADTQAAERALEQIPWVADAKVTATFPHSATIEIDERAAIATYRGPDQRYRVIDREGRVLDVLAKYPFAYVLIEGPDPTDLEPGEFAPAGYQGAAELAKNLTGSIRGRVDRVEVTADGSRLVLWLDDGTEVRFGEARDLFAKLVRLETVLTLNPDRQPGPIDVTTDQITITQDATESE